MWNDGIEGKSLFLLLVLCVLAVPFCIARTIREEKEWQSFLVQHKCKKVGHMRGDVRTPDKNGYVCDDGMTYGR